jgi:hypothetical protein
VEAATVGVVVAAGAPATTDVFAVDVLAVVVLATGVVVVGVLAVALGVLAVAVGVLVLAEMGVARVSGEATAVALREAVDGSWGASLPWLPLLPGAP